MSSMDWSLAHFAFCFYLTGMIWVIQLIHYPAFCFISEKEFVHFHTRHTSIMGVIVGPVMVLEFLTALLLCFKGPVGWWLNLAGVLGIWLVTFLVSVPIHNKLVHGLNIFQVEKLIRTNWLRTWLWSLRSVVFLGMIILNHNKN